MEINGFLNLSANAPVGVGAIIADILPMNALPFNGSITAIQRLQFPFLLLLLCAMSVACGQADLNSEDMKRIYAAEGTNLNSIDLNPYLPHIYSNISKPVPDMLDFEIAQRFIGDAMRNLGILDVTKSPFLVDHTGNQDVTVALQEAINFARDHQLLCYLPAGIYCISDTLECVQGYYLRANYSLGHTYPYPVLISGSTADPQKRTVLLLTPRSAGFNDPENRKMVVAYRAMPKPWNTEPQGNNTIEGSQANICYNNYFGNIDIVIGEGNPGAVGIRMRAAEGSMIENVTIDATHGLAGMQGLAGSGGSHHNLTFIGGRYGLDVRGYSPQYTLGQSGSQPSPCVAAAVFRGQTEAAVVSRTRGPLVGVGWDIELTGNVPAFKVLESDGMQLNGTLALVDSKIHCRNRKPGHAIIESRRSFLLTDVYVKGADRLFEEEGIVSPESWTHIQMLARRVGPDPKVHGRTFSEAIYFNREAIGDQLKRLVSLPSGASPPLDLLSKHTWDHSFPRWDAVDQSIANVKDAPYGAIGDGIADDTLALQRAIDENECVFLPKGLYNITATLKLRASTKLFGIAKNLSAIVIQDPSCLLNGTQDAVPLVETADIRNADTVIAHLGIISNLAAVDKGREFCGHYALKWQSGGKSIFKNVLLWNKTYGPHQKSGGRPVKDTMVRICGNGGGRFYTFSWELSEGFAWDTSILSIEGVKGPLCFYHLHAQHGTGRLQVKIHNSSDIDIFGIKTEGDGKYSSNESMATRFITQFLESKNTSHLRIVGYSGLVQARKGGSHMVFENVSPLIVSNFGEHLNPLFPVAEYRPLLDTSPAGSSTLGAFERPILYLVEHATVSDCQPDNAH
jgi:hypothetical protein